MAYLHKVCSRQGAVVEELVANTVDRDLAEGKDVSSRDEESSMAKRPRMAIRAVEVELEPDSRHSDETSLVAASLDDHGDGDGWQCVAWVRSDIRERSRIDWCSCIDDMDKKVVPELSNRRRRDRSKDQKQRYMVPA